MSSLSLSLEHVRRCRARDPEALPDWQLWTLARRYANRERAASAEHFAKYGPPNGRHVAAAVGPVRVNFGRRADRPAERPAIVYQRTERSKARELVTFSSLAAAAAWFESVARAMRDAEYRDSITCPGGTNPDGQTWSYCRKQTGHDDAHGWPA